MSKKSEQVKSGYASLDTTERTDVIRFINEFEESASHKRQSLTESADKLSGKSVGPRNTNGCACCGK